MINRKEYFKEHYQDNKDRYTENSTAYYLKNRSHVLEKCKEYRNRNKDRIKSNYLKKIHRYWAQNSIYNHRKRKFIIKVTTDELENLAKNTQECLYCGEKLNWSWGRGHSSHSPTLDRINNEVEIRIDNVEIICRRCNATKYDRSKEDFIRYCEMIVNRLRK
jgi:5-methylcytosine-specific restriction endonuclease McrA